MSDQHLRKTAWDLQRAADELARAVGSNVDNPAGLVARPDVTFSIELESVAPAPGIPTRMISSTRPADAAARSMFEIVAMRAELRIDWLQVQTGALAVPHLAFSTVTAIQFASTVIAGGSFLWSLPAALVLQGTRIGDINSNDFQPPLESAGSGAYFVKGLPPIPVGRRLIIYGPNNNDDVTIHLVFREMANLQTSQ